MAELGTARLLNCLDVSVDEIKDKKRWAALLRELVCSPEGLKDLSPNYWHLLAKLVSGGSSGWAFASDDVKLLKSLEEAEEWEKLEIWVVIAWQTLPEPNRRYGSASDLVDDVKEATCELLLRRPSALPRLEHLWKTRGTNKWAYKDTLQGVCDQAKSNQLPP